MTTMNSIILEVGKPSAVYKLSTDIDKQIEEISTISVVISSALAYSR